MKQFLLLALVATSAVYAQTNNTKMSAPSENGKAQQQEKVQSGQRPQSGTFKWYTNFDEASMVASQSRRPMVLYFTGSDWCGWCKKMDQEVFASSEFQNAVGGKYIFVKLDFPMNSKLPESEMRQNAQLKQRYGVTGYPTLVLIDSEGSFIGETGYRSGGGRSYAEWLDTFFGK